MECTGGVLQHDLQGIGLVACGAKVRVRTTELTPYPTTPELSCTVGAYGTPEAGTAAAARGQQHVGDTIAMGSV